ncbi:MAG: GatB/YqeY domain-containing protein [Clostridia bacterium]|nr:GatB/YqeY domain-containing protein [Clostridia bacterium]
MLKDQLLNDLKDAMKNKDELKKNTVQMIRAAILQVEKDNGIELDDAKILEVIAKESKKRIDAAADFEKSGREDLIEQNRKELEIISSYLPKQLSVEEVEEKVKEIISKVGAQSIKDMGLVMKEAKNELGVTANGKVISDAVKKLLS